MSINNDPSVNPERNIPGVSSLAATLATSPKRGKKAGHGVNLQDASGLAKASNKLQPLSGIYGNNGIAGVSYAEDEQPVSRNDTTGDDQWTAQLVQKGIESCNLNKISDQILRDLLIELIKVFARMVQTQRTQDTTILRQIVESFTAKISEMETAKKEQYSASFAQALAGIIGGAVSTLLAAGGGFMQIGQTKQLTSEVPGKLTGYTQRTAIGDWGSLLANSSQGASQLSNSAGTLAATGATRDKMEADIRATAQDQVYAILQKAQDTSQNLAKSVFEYINSFLSFIQQLLQRFSAGSGHFLIPAQKHTIPFQTGSLLRYFQAS